MTNYPKWSQGITPNTNKNAKINKHREVRDVRAIKVINASYRGATFSGYFEVEDQTKSNDPVKELPSGKTKVTVVCSWFGVVPITTYPNIDVSSATYEIKDGYCGLVVDNLGE